MIPVRCLHILYIKHLLPETCKNLFFTALRHQLWPCRFSCIKQFKFLESWSPLRTIFVCLWLFSWSDWNANLSSIAVLYLGGVFFVVICHYEKVFKWKQKTGIKKLNQNFCKIKLLSLVPIYMYVALTCSCIWFQPTVQTVHGFLYIE